MDWLDIIVISQLNNNNSGSGSLPTSPIGTRTYEQVHGRRVVSNKRPAPPMPPAKQLDPPVPNDAGTVWKIVAVITLAIAPTVVILAWGYLHN